MLNVIFFFRSRVLRELHKRYARHTVQDETHETRDVRRTGSVRGQFDKRTPVFVGDVASWIDTDNLVQ